MSLFQNSVLNKYLKEIPNEDIEIAWEKFKDYFHNPEIQENIRNSKEEQYQGEFLIDLFVNIFGFVKNPNPNFNLTTELKNVKDSKKVDGAILKNDEALAVIELKGTNTIDLAKVEEQAFGYKNNQPKCVYVITSNFEKLRFYIDNAVEHEEFNLFKLDRKRFEILWLCLSAESLLANIPKQIKDESLSQDEIITKQLYKDYSEFRNEIFSSIVENNPNYDKLTLFKKTQKLLDRFLFILFAEDKLLLPPNSIEIILKDWRDLRDRYDEYFPLYDRFKKYFGYLNEGYKGNQHDIFAYNGGLFLPDEILDEIKIDDELLSKHTKILSNYDFASEVSVNILGHIFEHSLTEIENIQAELAGEEIDKGKTKRKKDGVFYTPTYITKYIVDNTIGKLCAEKKAELEINEDDYDKRKGRHETTKVKLHTKLNDYREWLLKLTICDPACGSGAFLNQALDFLISEHRYIDELYKRLEGFSLPLTDVENVILENNLFGVDINEESIEIAKLSLWLRTAQKGRKLTSLNNNIKCGNSLIDDPEIAGEKAFIWKKEFPKVFANGGFDVVIGNPPYLRVQGLRENFENESFYYEKKYKAATSRFDIYVLFMERAFELINKTGIVSFILPHKFLVSDFGVGIRELLAENKAVNSLLHFGSEMVFADASTYTCIINISKNNEKIKFKNINPEEIFEPFDFDVASYRFLSKDKWNLRNEKTEELFAKLSSCKSKIKDIFAGVYQGIVSGDNKAFYLYDCITTENTIDGFNEVIGMRIKIEKDICKKLANGKNISRYTFQDSDTYIIYPYKQENSKTVLIEESQLKNDYPKCYAFFESIKERLSNRGSKNMQYPYWYSLWNYRSILNQACFKILTPDVCFYSSMFFDETQELFYNDTSYALILPDNNISYYKFYLGILNSSLCWYFLKNTSSELRGGYFRFKTKYLEPFPIPKIRDVQNPSNLIDKADEIHSKSKILYKKVRKFLSYLQSQFPIEKFSKKLQNWHELKFGDFIKELNKAIKKIGLEKLTKSDEMEWMELFEKKKAEVQVIKTEIDKTDRKIDEMVYELYGLTEDEIGIVENSVG